VNVQLDSLVGIEEEESLQNQVSVYPNPIVDILHIRLPFKAEKLSVSNMDGHVIQTKVCSEKDIQLDLSGLQKGMYLLNIRFENSSVAKKLVVY